MIKFKSVLTALILVWLIGLGSLFNYAYSTLPVYMPPLKLNFENWDDGYVDLVGTYVKADNTLEIDAQISASKIFCLKSKGVCIDGMSFLYPLLVDSSEEEVEIRLDKFQGMMVDSWYSPIKKWNSELIVYKYDTECVEHTITINRLAQQVNKVGNRKDNEGCEYAPNNFIETLSDGRKISRLQAKQVNNFSTKLLIIWTFIIGLIGFFLYHKRDSSP